MAARPPALSTRYYLAILAWLASHAGMARDLMALAQELSAAVGVVAKWDLVKKLGDLLVPAVGDFPALSLDAEMNAANMSDILAAETHLLAAIQADAGVTAAAWDPEKLRTALTLLMQYLPLLLKLFG